MDHSNWTEFADKVKEIESKLVAKVKVDKLSYYDVCQTFDVVYHEDVNKVVWTICLGDEAFSFIILGNPEYVAPWNEETIVTYNQIADALKIPVKSNLEQYCVL